jgi:hypothetical protein
VGSTGRISCLLKEGEEEDKVKEKMRKKKDIMAKK